MSRRKFLKNSALLSSAVLMNISLVRQSALAQAVSESGLAEIYKDKFLIGAMVPMKKYLVQEPVYIDLVKKHFNSLVTQNVFKWKEVHPTDEDWTWEYTDRFVDFGKSVDMHMVGHHLISSTALPRGLFLKDAENYVNKEELQNKFQTHIQTLVDRYKGRIHAWDVVNEAIDNRTYNMAENIWHRVLGPEYIENAFQLAREADPEATLLYNDYNLFVPEKRQAVVELIRNLKSRNVPIDAIGMQGHFSLDGPEIDQVEASIQAFAAEGVKVHFTEMEVDVLPVPVDQLAQNENSSSLDIYKNGLPQGIQNQLRARYEEIFKLFARYSDVIDRVAFWGVTDDDSWKNDFPVEGRTNHPLLFDRNHNLKPAWHGVANAVKQD